MTEERRLYLLKNFIEEHFDYDDFRAVKLFDETIKRDDYDKQSEIICEYFGLKTIYEYLFEPITCHVTYVEGKRPKDEPFVTTIKAWHQD